MEQSRSWEANSCSGREEISCTLWYPKAHYCIHKGPPYLCPKPDQCRPQSISSISNLIFILSVPGTCTSSLSLRFPTKTLYAPLSLSVFHTCLMTCPSHASWFDEEYKSRSCQLCSFFQPPVALFFFGPSIFLSILFSNTLELRSSPCLTDHT